MQKVLQRVDLIRQLLQQRCPAGSRLFLHFRQAGTGIPQCLDFPRRGRTVENPGGQALDVKHMGQRLFEVGAGNIGRVQRLHCGKPGIDGFCIHQRLLDPGTQHPFAHGSFGFIQNPKQRAALFPAAHGFGQLQIGTGHRRKPHVLGIGVVLYRLDALQTMLLGFLQVVQQRRHRIGHQRIFFIAQGLAPIFAELAFHGGFHEGVLVAGFLPQFH